jgi:hypothetical protein
VRHPVRNLYLLRGPHRAYAEFLSVSWPNYWWPDDRAWCVITDTDWDEYCIAGSATCIDELLGACDR